MIIRRILARHPEVWLYALAVVAAGVLAWAPRSVQTNIRQGGGSSWLAAESGWMLMILAMMLPVIAPQARQVGMRSLWQRRHRAMLAYLLGYLSFWFALGVVVVGALHGLHTPHPPSGAIVFALLGAAFWQCSPLRRRMLRRCSSVRIGAAQGLAADCGCVSAGWRAGRLCSLACGPIMLVMAIGHDYLALMAGLLVLLITERARGPNPMQRAGRPLEAWFLIGYAAVFTVVAIV
jgi:hypothetical protein